MSADATAGDWTTERVVALIHEMAEESELPAHLKGATIAPSDTITQLGLDSLAAVMVIERLEETVGVEIPDDFLDVDATKIEDIAPKINALIAAGG